MVQRKIESQLLQGMREFRGQKMAANVTLAPVKLNADRKGLLKVDVSATVSDKLIARIKGLGGSIIYSSPGYNTIRAEINFSNVETIAGYPEVTFIQPAVLSITVGSGNPNDDPKANTTKRPSVNPSVAKESYTPRRPAFAERASRVSAAIEKYLENQGNDKYFKVLSGIVTSQGDRTHRADETRNRYGYAGQGIRIGVLSDSYNVLGGAPADVANGELPGPGNPAGNLTPVTVLADFTTGNDEGRAMLQIVHDLAPKAQLFFATANISEASFATNIQALRNAPYNCDIIIDDVFYYDEPVFQDGIVAQAVNAVTASGALYFSSAGNEGSLAKNTSGVWEGDFNDTGSPVFSGGTKLGTVHNFGTAAAPVNGNIVTATGNRYTLNWADPVGASANDYDLFLVSAAGVVKASSTNIQNGTQLAFEQIMPLALATGDRLVVFKTTAAQTRAFSVNTIRGRLTVATVGQTHGHSAAVTAFSVAAIQAATFRTTSPAGPFPGPFVSTNQVEPFTSDGPRRVFFNENGSAITPGNFLFGTNGGTVRNKPDITAADGVSTTLPPGGLNPFFGTSAAAPHAGAIAALLKSANPALTAAQIRAILIATALDIEAPGYDSLSGFGVVQAYQAMVAVNPAPQANVALGTVTTTEGSFNNGNGSIDAGELGNIIVQLTNSSLTPATSVLATLTTLTPGVTITQGSSSYGTITPSGSASNTFTPFVFGVNNTVPCGALINFVLTVTFGGGGSPQAYQFSVPVGAQGGATLSAMLGTPAPTGANFISATGTQMGRLNRNTPVSSCGIQKVTPIIVDATGARAYDAYTFTNTSQFSSCVTVTMNSADGLNLYTAAYDDGGFVPATPTLHFLADQGTLATTQTFAFTVAAGKQFTVVVHAVTPGTSVGTAYALSARYSLCAVSPPCNPVMVTTASIASGSTGSPYAQSFNASGGSSSSYFKFVLTGNLPAGLSFTGSTIFGIPTQAGTFPIGIIATDPTGCSSDTSSFNLVIAGNPPALITATFGTPQSNYPAKVFTQNFQATVKDAAGNLLPGVNVIFTAPATGASGTFTGGFQTVTIVTNNSGMAIAPAFTANAATGNYVVTATVNGVSAPANFIMSNSCPANFIVTSNADSGPGSLREILGIACPDVPISFDQSVNLIALTSGELTINRGVILNGPGAGRLTISGNNLSRIFNIASGTFVVNISGMTLRDGKPPATSANGGGAILINGGSSLGKVNLSHCTITNNDASLTLNPLGGAIDKEGSTLSIDRCSIINNTASFRAGAIQNQGLGSVIITNSTIAGNTAGTTGIGGGIRSLLPMTITNCTIFGNMAQTAGNISISVDTITFKNTIIGGGRLIGGGGSGPDISGGGFKSADYNLIENTATGTIIGVTTHNITGVKPNLLALANYGGINPVLLPQPNSPVINAGDPALVSGNDQRELPRLVGRLADIGAVETNYAFALISGTQQLTPTLAPFPLPLQAKITESGNVIAGDTVFYTPPLSGASGTFPLSSITASAVTNTAGIAISPVFTANNTTGTYNVTGGIGIEFPVINYVLTNVINAPLPVVFGAFTAKAANCQVQIQWKTFTELNSKEFIIEYSTDGTTYNYLSSIAAKGNASGSQAYDYTHGSPAEGTIYYRIKQSDLNGDFFYSNIITVVNSCGKMPIVAYPNPVRDKLIIQIPGTAKQLLTIHDGIGRLMSQRIVNGGRQEINVGSWARGVYILSVKQDGKTAYTVKIIKD